MAQVKPRILDLFCGAGGAAMGYHRAGFEVVGVDNKPQPRYPFQLVVADALAYLQNCGGGLFDAIHASPPCQAYTTAQRIQNREHPDLVALTRELLEATGLPYVIENVPGSPLIDPIVLEGQMFPELRTQRSRWFECSFPTGASFLRSPRPARQAKMGRKPQADEWMQVVGHFSDVEAGRKAMGIDWMTRDELKEAIPPAYTEFIGAALMARIGVRVGC